MSDTDSPRDERLAEILEQAGDEYRLTGALDVASWQARHPDLADELPALLNTLRALETAVQSCWADSAETHIAEAPAVPDTAVWAPGDEAPAPSRLGRYEIKGRLGRGGMGVVYRAYDPELGREVAVKVPRFDGPAEGRARAQARFRREARAAAAVRHPHVCPVYDVGDLDGVPYVVMAYIEGRSLAALAAEGPVEPRRAAEIVRQVAEGLAAVHAHGIVHRDLKPANVLLDTAGQALLTDFGLVRCDDGNSLTADGTLAGTPAYMAPEQASLTAGAVGPWTDIYSLGVVLYELLAGRPPFRGDPVTVVYQVAQEVPPPPSQFRPRLDPALEAIVLRAMARRPEDRYPSAAAFAEAVAGWLAGEAGAKPPAPAPKPVRRRPVRLRVALAAALLCAAVAVAGAVIIIKDQKGKVEQTIRVLPDHTITIQPEPVAATVKPPPQGEGPAAAVNEKEPKAAPAKAPKEGSDPLAGLTREAIPAAERFAWQPEELVAVFGTHAWESWRGGQGWSYPWDDNVCLLFAPDGRQVIGLDRYGGWTRADLPNGDTMKTWDAATGKLLHRFTLRKALAFDLVPEMRALAMTAGDDIGWTAKLWNIDTGKEKLELSKDGRPPRLFAASPDGKWIVSWTGNTSDLRLWDAATGQEQPPMPYASDGTVVGASFSPDSKTLAVIYSGGGGQRAGNFKLYDLTTRTETGSAHLEGKNFYGRPVFTPDGKAVLVGRLETDNGYGPYSVGLWDLTEKKWGALNAPGGCFALSPDGKHIAVSAHQTAFMPTGTGGVYDVATGERIAAFDGPPLAYALTFSPDGKRVAGVNDYGPILVYDAATGKLLTPRPDPFTFMAVSGDGTLMAVPEPRYAWQGNEHLPTALRLVETATCKVRFRIRVPETQPGFTSAALSPDGKVLAVGNPTASGLELYDTTTGERFGLLPQGGVQNLAFSADGKNLVALSVANAVLKVWYTPIWRERASFSTAHDNGFGAFFSVSADGKAVADVTSQAATVFDAVSNQARTIRPNRKHQWGWLCALSPDGSRLAFEGKIYDTTTRRELAELQRAEDGIPQPLTDLVFAPDGKSLFASGQDGRLVHWSATDGSILKDWHLGGYIQRLALTGDGRYLFISNQNGTVYVLRLTPAAPAGS